MFVLGLAGAARSGKDTVADYLVKRYGFVKFSFSDALYREVQQAFSLPDQSLLRDAATKDTPSDRLIALNCLDDDFIKVVAEHMPGYYMADVPMSPRQVLQWWGTEYRRAQNPNYWLDKASDFLDAMCYGTIYPEHAPQHFVNTSVRFPNEQAWIHSLDGNVWHLRRDGLTGVADHVSERPLPVLSSERQLFNNDTVDRLYHGVQLMMSTAAEFVRVEPMRKTEEEHETA